MFIPRLMDAQGVFSFTNLGTYWTEVALSGDMMNFNVIPQIGLMLRWEVAICTGPSASHRVFEDLGIDHGCKKILCMHGYEAADRNNNLPQERANRKFLNLCIVLCQSRKPFLGCRKYRWLENGDLFVDCKGVRSTYYLETNPLLEPWWRTVCDRRALREGQTLPGQSEQG